MENIQDILNKLKNQMIPQPKVEKEIIQQQPSEQQQVETKVIEFTPKYMKNGKPMTEEQFETPFAHDIVYSVDNIAGFTLAAPFQNNYFVYEDPMHNLYLDEIWYLTDQNYQDWFEYGGPINANDFGFRFIRDGVNLVPNMEPATFVNKNNPVERYLHRADNWIQVLDHPMKIEFGNKVDLEYYNQVPVVGMNPLRVTFVLLIKGHYEKAYIK